MPGRALPVETSLVATLGTQSLTSFPGWQHVTHVVTTCTSCVTPLGEVPCYQPLSSGLVHRSVPVAILDREAILEDSLSAPGHTLRMTAQRAEGGWVPDDPGLPF